MTVTKITNYIVTLQGTPEELNGVRYAAQYQQANDTSSTLNNTQVAAVAAFETALEE